MTTSGAVPVLPASSQPTASLPPAVALPGPPGRVTFISSLPGHAARLALTIDDGLSSPVVAAWIELARRSGIRLTFFVNPANRSWTDNVRALRPLVDSGQIQLGNHTWNHPRLTDLPDAEVAAQISRTDTFLRNTYGVDARPFFRPPYGLRDKRTDAIARDLGYPAAILWNGSLGDWAAVSGETVLANARTAFTTRAIVLGHANQPGVTTVYDKLLALLAERRLMTATLSDVFLSP